MILTLTTPLILAIFITVVATTNTFTDSIPSIYLGAPEESTALSVLPGHKLLIKGKGHEAITLTVIGGLLSLILGLILVPFLLPTIKAIFPYLKKIIVYLLIISVLFLLYREKKSRLFALTIFLLSGLLGMVTLSFPNLNQPLFPLFSGLFGISTLAISLNSNAKIPKQEITTPKLNKKSLFKIIPISVFSGGLVSTLPAMGSSQAAIIGSSLLKKIKISEFLMMIGGINTVNFVLSFVSLYVIDKARNGAVVAISQILTEITTKDFIIFLTVAAIAAGISAITTIKISKIFVKYITKVNYQTLILAIIAFIISLVVIISGFYGFLILIVGTFIGVLPTLRNIGKNHLMGSLMLPIILFYLL